MTDTASSSSRAAPSGAASPSAPRRPHSNLVLGIWAALALIAFAGFVALGIWQVERRAWKLELIERVDQRVHAAAVEAPGPERWPGIDAAGDEYRRVRLTGSFLHERETLVQATTDLGGGFWVMTPFAREDGTTVLVNRGFVSPERRARETRTAGEPQGETTVTGLLRISEPHGGFLRANDPAAQRWYSRDVAAIAAAHGLERVAPYFVDAEAQAPRLPGLPPAPDATWPIGGMTVVRFNNNHLVYTLTWWGLALMVAAAAAWVAREERRLRRDWRRTTLSPHGQGEDERDR